MFEDKVFDDLDDISKLIEPYVYSVNDEVAKLPNEIDLDYGFIINEIREHYRSAPVIKESNALGYKGYSRAYAPFYTVECSNNSLIDTDNEKLNATIKLVKTKKMYSEDDMKSMISSAVSDITNNKHTWSMPRANDIADTFDIANAKKTRSFSTKRRLIMIAIRDMLEKDTLKIRDVDLMYRFIGWISAYIENNNLGAMSNICKLKVLSHKKRAIYSIMDEVKI